MVDLDAFLSEYPWGEPHRIVNSFLRQSLKQTLIETYGGHWIWSMAYSADFNLAAVEKELRTQLQGNEWLFVTTGRMVEGIFPSFGIAPVLIKKVAVAYHATRACIVPRIFELGLLPSNAQRKATDFPDTEGLIHLCAKLTGKEKDRDSIVWWRKELSKQNRFNDPSWTILQIEMSHLPSGARVYQDMHSDSGLIVDGIEWIPATLISEVASPPPFIADEAEEK